MFDRLRKRYHGLIVESDPGADRAVSEVPTLQCGHCGGHFEVRPGSGKVRGWCMNCARPVCGPGCEACVPVEQMLENMERGRPLDFKPIIVTGG